MLVAAAFASAWAPSGWAQSLPSSVVQSVAGLGDLARQQIQEYVDRSVADLNAQDPVRIRDARNQLLLPLTDPKVGVPFRHEYSRQLAPRLEALAQDARPIVAVNALRLAGDVASDRSAEVLLGQFENKDASVRLAAAAGVARVFESIRDTAPALNPQAGSRLLERTAERLGAEPEPHVADALARALVTAASVERSEFPGLSARALELLSARVADRIKGMKGQAPTPAGIDTILRTLTTASIAMADDNARPVARRLPEATAKGTARLAAESLGLLIDLTRGGQLPVVDPGAPREELDKAAAARAWAVSAAAAADNIAYFARNRLGDRASQSNPPLSERLAPGRRDADAQFITDASSLRAALSRF